MTHVGPVDARAAERAEFYLTLARAFLPPTDAALRQAIAEDLADSLDDLCTTLGYAAGGPLAALRAACADPVIAQADGGMLLAYGRLFLTPPVPVSLNAGVALDGAVMGQSTLEMEDWYARHGVARDEAFRDLPDHLTLQLEFLALLIDKGEAGEAAAWARRMMLPWICGLAEAIAAASAEHPVPVHPYHALSRLLAVALAHDFAEAPVEAGPFAEAIEQVAAAMTGAEALCIRCNAVIGVEGELAAVEKILTERGLPTAHLRICPDCRDRAQGYTHQPIPGVDRLKATDSKAPPRRHCGE